MRGVVDMTVDSGNDVSEVVDITDDSEDDITEVRAGDPPLWFSGYRRGRELGRGRSGQVFVCSRKGCSNGFAVKTVNLERLKLSADAEREQRHMRRELEILKRLPPHRNVVRLVATFEQGNWLLLVLELVAGGDLFTVLTARATQRLFEREAAFVLRQLACGLRFLHGQGVIHRDLKLENVLVASARRRRPLTLYSVKITDFGLSKAVGTGLSEARSAVGTRPYAAPEVLREEAQDFSSDLWCLGVLLYLLLAGRFPFEASTQLQQRDVESRVASLASHSDEAKSVLIGLLQLEPARRSSLEVLAGCVWLRDDTAAERPQKRSSCGEGAVAAPPPVAVSPAPVVAAAAEPALQAAAPSAARALHSEAAFNELMELAAGLQTEAAPDEPMGDAAVVEVPGAGQANMVPDAPMEDVLSAGAAGPDQAPATGDVPPETRSPEQGVTLVNAGVVALADVPKGVWTPFAVESTVRLCEVHPPSPQADVMQVRMVVPDRCAGFILGKNGSRIQQIAAAAGCPVWMTTRHGTSDRHIVMIGNYKQCKVAQELVHEQLANALHTDWQDTEAEVLLLVRAEAAGVVTGKQGFVLNQIREQSGARIQLLREEVEGQRPCILTGTLQTLLRAEKHVFDLVRAVPITPPA